VRTGVKWWILVAALALVVCVEARAETLISTDSLRITFDDSGRMQSAIACFPSCSAKNPSIQQFGDDSLIRFEQATAGRWKKKENRSEAHYELEFSQVPGAVLTWRIPVHGYLLELDHSGIDRVSIISGASFRPRDAAGFGSWLEQSRYVVLHSGDVRQIGLDDTDVGETAADQWVGYRNRYWALMAAPPSKVQARFHAAEDKLDADIGIGMAAGTWSFYLGPVEPGALGDADPALNGLLYAGLWSWLRWVCFALFHLLIGIHTVVSPWGLAVIVLALTVNLLMTPLTRIADRYQHEVNDTEARLAPELQHIKKNHKGEEQAAKILALYKMEGVHPLYSLKGLVGVAVIIPVFVGVFNMLAENIHLLNTGFLWISDLSRPDDLFRLPFTLPFFGNELNLLPFLMTGLSVAASVLHKPLAGNAELRNRQLRNLVLMAVAFFVLFYTFPAGMVLYWTTTNLISVIKSLWARR
jgi:YidC/Oxa1 family membrane protein insertase